MRVALDTNPLYTTRAGVARYVRGLRQGLAELHSSDLEITELGWPIENFDYRQPARAAKTFYRELLWAPFVARRWLARNDIDVLHSTAGPFIYPPDSVHEVVTLHDLAVLRFPNRFRPWHRASTQKRLRRLHKANRVICVSQFTADEAIKLLNIKSEKLMVVHNGITALQDDILDSPTEITWPSDFFLFVGSLEPGKNLILLRNAYELANARCVTLPRLIIIGARWAGVAGEGPPPKSWVYLGEQSDAVVSEAYRRARALLFPSMYEGFGFPILEAQLAGCPVICSRVASIPEVAGAGALFVKPTPEDYLDGMCKVETNRQLRDNLIGEGKKNVARFSWRRCAEQTVAAYRGSY